MITVQVALLGFPFLEPFTYAVPDAHSIVPGLAVVVPLGSRQVTGVVTVGPVEAAPTTDPAKIRFILQVLDEVPVCDTSMLQLTKWVADYYVCGWGEVLRAALPNGIGRVSQLRYYVRAGSEPEDSAIQQAVFAELKAKPGQTLQELLHVLGPELRPSLMRSMEQRGILIAELVLEAAKVRVKTEKHLRFTLGTQANLPQILPILKGAKQRQLVLVLDEWTRAYRPEPAQKTLLAEANVGASTAKSLIEAGLLEVVEKEVIRTPYGDEPDNGAAHPPAHVLHSGQRLALDALEEAIENRVFSPFLLHGVTGSGKTEVYIAALKKVLARRQTGMVLVPEIALTPQTVHRFREHFGDRIAVLHSRMSDGERYDAWRLLREGRYDVVIGPRSAVFAPLRNIGLIVVDEEHESSYKQFDPAPRYHARDVAVYRALLAQATVVLGSATPSIESHVNAEQGKYTRLSMPVRVPVAGHAAAPLPEVETIDLTLEQKKKSLSGSISRPLKSAIQLRLSKGEQVILLQNRRGYAPVLSCVTCGWTAYCPSCAVTLTLHKNNHQLRCHYCGYHEPVPHRCPKCHAASVKEVGVGTQKVEEELQALFPEARILRMDQDTTGRKEAHEKLLSAFGRGEADILLGTQMVAKGLDFPRVTLVGVVNADTGLLFPDFRAAEQTFQLLAQVAGRAGRGHLRGEVIFQTRNPRHPAIFYAERHDFHNFIASELPARSTLHYPPYGRLVAVEFGGPDEERTQKLAEDWTSLLREIITEKALSGKRFEVNGPMPPMIPKIKRIFRFHTLLKVSKRIPVITLQQLLREAQMRYGNPPKNYRVAIDVDPIGLL